MLLDRVIAFFTSLRLTVVCLALAMVLVLAGTLAQVHLGLYEAQQRYFQSFFVFWTPQGSSLRIPVFPGGYLVGGVLLINLVASHLKRFKMTADKAGIWMVHLGLILLLVGQLLTDLLSQESTLHLREGEAKNYSVADRQAELVIIDPSDPQSDKVFSIPQKVLMGRREVRHPELPFTIRVQQFYPNSIVENRGTNTAVPAAATQGIGPLATVKPLPKVTVTDRRDVPSAIVEAVTDKGSLGTWLVSEYIEQPQTIEANGRNYQIQMRPRRFYKPFSIQLVDFRHDVYPGTTIPKNFSSRVILNRAETGENREVLIYMNNPLRYAGETFYQASFDPDDQGTILQVVRNPGWLTPYVACIVVGLGLVVQFATHLFGFTLKRRTQ